MKKIVVTALFFSLLVANWLFASANAQPPLQTIYIRHDGSIDPPTAPIQRDGDIYTLTDNIVNQSMMVEKDNTMIDGAGYTLEGGHIWLENRLNVTIKNIHHNLVVIIHRFNFLPVLFFHFFIL